MWLVPLPVARVPSWHDVQVPVTCAWSTLVAGFQALVTWQESQVLLVGEVGRALAGGARAVVAREAGAAHLRVIDAYGRLPGRYAVAGLAAVARGQVRGRLARGTRAVVAAGAAAGDALVGEARRRGPRGRRVAAAAFRRRRDVRGALAGGRRAVVAARAACPPPARGRRGSPASRRVVAWQDSQLVGREDVGRRSCRWPSRRRGRWRSLR